MVFFNALASQNKTLQDVTQAFIRNNFSVHAARLQKLKPTS
jgi:hypothetical protein